MQQSTTSLCNVCYAEIPAVANPFGEDVPMLYKICPEHGMQRALLEADSEFYNKFNTYDRKNHYPILIINVTDRCNIQCPHCFYPIANKWDMPLEEFQRIVRFYSEDFSGFIISGGEPTLWAHYFEAAEWCNQNGIILSQLTNGVRFSEEEFFAKAQPLFTKNNFFCAEISIHPPGYNKPEVREKQLAVLQKLRDAGLKATCVMMNVDPPQTSSIGTDNIMVEVVKFMQEWRDVVATYRIRPICFGWASKQRPKLFLSHLVKSLKRTCAHFGYEIKHSFLKDIDNIYNQNFLVNGMDVVTVCAAPTVGNIDLGYLNRGPWMLANDGVPYSVPHALIVNEGMEKGYYRGQCITG